VQNVNELLVTSAVDVTLPENTWLVVEYREVGSFTFIESVVGKNTTTFNASGHVISGLAPGDYEIRLVVKNWNCGLTSTIEGSYTIGTPPE
jgi:hypothetical protein